MYLKSFIYLNPNDMEQTWDQEQGLVVLTSWITPNGERTQDHSKAQKFTGSDHVPGIRIKNIPSFMQEFFPQFEKDDEGIWRHENEAIAPEH